MAIVSNYGSAIGEAIGTSMEKALEVLLNKVADKYNYYYLTAGVRKTKAGNPPKKLLMFDNFGNDYDIDGVIANEAMQPLILFESISGIKNIIGIKEVGYVMRILQSEDAITALEVQSRYWAGIGVSHH